MAVTLPAHVHVHVHVHSHSSKLAPFSLLRFARRGNMANVQKGFLESISPWPSRTSTPTPDRARKDPANAPRLEKSHGDHTVTHRHRLRRKDYPPDCPKSNIRWFYAVDVSKSPSMPCPGTESSLCSSVKADAQAKASAYRPTDQGCQTTSTSKEIRCFLPERFTVGGVRLPAIGRDGSVWCGG